MEARDVGRKVGSGRQRWSNLYITRACADDWKGTRQLVYELTVLSFSLSVALSLSRVVRFVSVSFGLALRSIRFCPRVRSIRIVPPFRLVLPSPFHSVLPLLSHSVLVYAAVYRVNS